MDQRKITDTSEEYRLNPHNEPWKPGYRFCVKQPAKTRAGYSRMRTREYFVFFKIDVEGTLKHSGGVKPTEATLEWVAREYAKGRPGSNY